MGLKKRTKRRKGKKKEGKGKKTKVIHKRFN
jgi:hypothetical protein